MIFRIELEQEEDGRWIAEVLELTGAMAYGPTRDEAVARVKALALRVIAEKLKATALPNSQGPCGEYSDAALWNSIET